MFGFNDCQRKFLNNLGYTRGPGAAVFVSMCFHPLWCYIFIQPENLNLGIKGAGISNIITNTITFTINIIYTFYIPEIQDAVFWPDRRIFVNLS